MNEMLDQLLQWQREIEALPPRPRAIRLHHSVPPGRVFRQWNTRGDLYVWANPSVLDGMKHMKYGGIHIASSDIVAPDLWGVPVVHG